MKYVLSRTVSQCTYFWLFIYLKSHVYSVFIVIQRLKDKSSKSLFETVVLWSVTAVSTVNIIWSFHFLSAGNKMTACIVVSD